MEAIEHQQKIVDALMQAGGYTHTIYLFIFLMYISGLTVGMFFIWYSAVGIFGYTPAPRKIWPFLCACVFVFSVFGSIYLRYPYDCSRDLYRIDYRDAPQVLKSQCQILTELKRAEKERAIRKVMQELK